MPPAPGPHGRVDKTRNMYGTTLRVWDPTIQAWRITWVNPGGDQPSSRSAAGVGQRRRPDRRRPTARVTRWTFTDITPDSFRWLGEALQPDGKTWKLEGEFRASRSSR